MDGSGWLEGHARRDEEENCMTGANTSMHARLRGTTPLELMWRGVAAVSFRLRSSFKSCCEVFSVNRRHQ